MRVCVQSLHREKQCLLSSALCDLQNCDEELPEESRKISTVHLWLMCVHIVYMTILSSAICRAFVKESLKARGLRKINPLNEKLQYLLLIICMEILAGCHFVMRTTRRGCSSRLTTDSPDFELSAFHHTTLDKRTYIRLCFGFQNYSSRLNFFTLLFFAFLVLETQPISTFLRPRDRVRLGWWPFFLSLNYPFSVPC